MSELHRGADDQLAEQASRWLIRLSADDVSTADRAAFRAWVAQDPAHRAAIDELQALWSDLDTLSGVAMHEPEALPIELTSEIDRCGLEAEGAGSALIPPSRAERPWLGWLAAAVILAAVIALWLVVHGGVALEPGQPAAMEYVTEVGQRQEVMLADGSVVWLNTDTRMLVAMTQSQRSAHLVFGEAYFSVASDPLRPFVVTAGEDSITALGTAFNVYHRKRTTRVTVLEGAVEVSRPARDTVATSSSKQRVHVAQAASLDPVAPRPEVIDLQPMGAVNAAAWRRGKLFFDAVTLAEMVDTIDAYIPGRIYIADESIEGFVGGGVVHIDDVSSILRALELSWPVTVRRESSELIVLSRREQPDPS
jgi:transmembrane sensor